MTFYYYPVYHTNTTDEEEEVAKITATKEERKTIHSIIIFSWTNASKIRLYHEREELAEIPGGENTIQNSIEIPVNLDLKEGEEFKVTLQNRTSGTNASIKGVIKYTIA